VRAGGGDEAADSAGEIERSFREYFRGWNLSLPAESVAERRGGHIYAAGLHVGYAWGVERAEEYVEVLAQDRLTNDSRFRIFASGRLEELPAPGPSWSHGPDATEAEIRTAEAAFVERNRRIYAELRERGLLPPAGANLPTHEINEYLRSGGDVGEADAD
jgi:hypothetical protein